MAKLQREFYTTLVRCYGVLLLPSVVQSLFLIGYKYSAAYKDVFTIAGLFCMVLCVWFIFQSKAEPSYGEIVVSALVCAPAFAILFLLFQLWASKIVADQNSAAIENLENLALYLPPIGHYLKIGLGLGAVGLAGLVLRLFRVPLPAAMVKKAVWSGVLLITLPLPSQLAYWLYAFFVIIFDIALTY